MSVGLTAKQALFVEHYLTCLNATEAARRAGYSERTAYSIGWENLRKPEIAAAVHAGMAERAMPADEVLLRLTQHAQADPRALFSFDDEGNVTGLRLTRDAPLHLIKSITPTKYGDKLELHDAQAALALLGKHHMLFNDMTLNVDLSALSDEQVARLAAGESLATVLRTKKDTAPVTS